jgi:hypothetical protein
VLSKSRIFKFLKRDCGTIPVAEITSGKIEIFAKHKNVVTQSRTGLQIYEGHDDQLSRPGPMA